MPSDPQQTNTSADIAELRGTMRKAPAFAATGIDGVF